MSATIQNENLNTTGTELLGGLSESVFAASGPAMAALGWSVFPQETSGERRMPGKLHGRVIRWSEEQDLANTPPTPDFLRDCALQCASHNVANVFGPASGNTFALDIDVMDAAMSDAIVGIAEDILGSTPFMRVGRAPKIALIYRHAPGDVVRSVSRRFANADGTPGEHGLEILGAGKLITMHGRHHKTGRYFTWTGSANPLLDGPELAPMVTAGEVDRFLAAVDARFPYAKAPTVPFAGFTMPALATRKPGEAAATDGREKLLSDLVWARTRAAGEAILASEGSDLEGVLFELCAAIAAEFASMAQCDGRWAPAGLAREVGGRVQRLASRIRAGEVKPDRRSVLRAKAAEVSEAASDLPVILLEVGEIESVVTAAEKALAAAGRGIYQSGGRIVSVGETQVYTAAGAEIGSQRIYQVGDYALLEHLASSARWEKFDGRKDEVVRTVPPMWVAKSLSERAGRLQLPVLAGVISAPTLRRDGSILAAEGYDASTGLLLDTHGASFPEIPENPTRDDALAALEKLNELIETFPFVTATDRAVALSAILTAAVRSSLTAAPLYGDTAPVAGSGKSLLVHIISILISGTEVGVIAQGSTDEEFEKRLASVLLGGDPIIAIDNCKIPVGGDLLDQIITQSKVRPRILGKSETPEVPAGAFVTATGNNLVVVADMVRRTMLCRLDPQVERPELRAFSFDPKRRARDGRGEYLVAALTVLRAYQVAGMPEQGLAPVGSLHAWSRRVRDALVWLGEPDAAASMELVREMDPQLDSITSVITQWCQALGAGFYTARDLVEAAFSVRPTEDGGSAYVNPDFRESLMAVAGDGRVVTTRRLGKWLMAHSGRIVAGTQISKGPMRDGVVTWGLSGKGAGPAAW